MSNYKRHSLLERLGNKFLVGDDCWEWIGAKEWDGYGIVGVRLADDRMVTQRAHRVLYELFVGPIPAGKHLDHLCRNRSCVRPSHLEPVTVAENNRRKIGHYPKKYIQTRSRVKSPWKKANA